MSRLILLAFVLWTVSGSVSPLPDSAPLLTDEEIDAINAAGFWIADKSLIEGKTLGDLRRTRGHSTHFDFPIEEFSWDRSVTLPASFDSRTQWPSCVHPIQNEGDCEGSWAMAAVDALSDRYCTQSSQQVALSSQYILNCQTAGSGCNGGTASSAWSYLSSQGSALSSCVPFNGNSANCPLKCSNGSQIVKYKSSAPQTLSGIASIQAAIAQSGSVESCFQMYTDFQAYRSGVYIKSSGSLIGAECVRLIGWGVQGTTNYWIGAAYLGTGWGQAGFFYMKMGQTNLGLESGAIAANPSS